MKLAVYTNPVASGWSPTDPDTWGGGEEAIVYFTDAIRARGHDLDVFFSPADIDTPTPEGYWPYAEAPGRAGTYDLAIYRKTPEAHPLRLAPRAVLWTDQTLAFDPSPFARIIVASPFLVRCLAGLLPSTAPKLVQIPDGYDAVDVTRQEGETIDHARVVYASSPDRGLIPLLSVWRDVLAKRPDARLDIAYGWELFDRCGGPQRIKQAAMDLLARYTEAERLTVHMARMPRPNFHRILRTAGVFAYWCLEGEGFCQVAVKAQVAGCYPVVRPWGALHETVWRGTKLLTDDLAQFAPAIVAAMDPARQASDFADHPAPAHVAQTWAQVAETWERDVLEPALANGHAQVDVPATVRHLGAIPSTPLLLPQPTAQFHAVVPPAVMEVLQAFQPDPLHVSAKCPVAIHRNGQICGPLPAGISPAGVMLGFEFEDDAPDPAAQLRATDWADGTRIIALCSIGGWRKGQRRRLLRRDIAECFGQQPELMMRVVQLDNRGNAVLVVTFCLQRATLGTRNLARVAALTVPRETLAACFITYNASKQFLRALDSIAGIVDQVVIVDNGSTDNTLELARDWSNRTRVDTVVWEDGINPRFCFDCQRRHEIGEMAWGHHLAGFETPRNQSIALAGTDWVLWMDADEELKHADLLPKYLRKSMFNGYAIAQHHFSVEPPGNLKTDRPVRVFRRRPNGSKVGIHPDENGWPTFYTGCATRFAGIVHEHPGEEPDYVNGVMPVIGLGDVSIPHSGYYTEDDRRGRFMRNWPLMASDREKYPHRRLTKFLHMRDIHHHLQVEHGASGGQSPKMLEYAQNLSAMWDTEFCDVADPFTQDAANFATPGLQLLGRGQEYKVHVEVRKPEVSGDEAVVIDFNGRLENFGQLQRMIAARGPEITGRWDGSYL